MAHNLATPPSSPIEKLPTELIENITSFLSDKKDLCSVRRASHFMLKNTHSVAMTGLFQTVRATTTFRGLTRLVDISEHHRLAPIIRVLELHPFYLQKFSALSGKDQQVINDVLDSMKAGDEGYDPYERWYFDDYSGCYDGYFKDERDESTARNIHSSRLQKQERFIESEGDVKLLATVLANLPNLRETFVGYNSNMKPTLHYDTQQWLGPWDGFIGNNYHNALHRGFTLFMKALSSSNVSLTRFHAGSLRDAPYGNHDQSYNVPYQELDKELMRQSGFRKSFANLESLTLVSEQFGARQWDAEASRAFIDLLSCTSKLTTLELCFDEIPNWIFRSGDRHGTPSAFPFPSPAVPQA